MPVSPDNIVKKEDLAELPYLDAVHISHIQADVELLIGKLLETWEVVNCLGVCHSNPTGMGYKQFHWQLSKYM